MGRAKIAFSEKVTKHNDELPPDVSLSGDLDEAVRLFHCEHVKATLELLMQGSLFVTEPLRVKGVFLTATVIVKNPENSKADEFLIWLKPFHIPSGSNSS
jgi:hypothetical protein